MGKLAVILFILLVTVYVNSLPAHNSLARQLTKLVSILKSGQEDSRFNARRGSNGPPLINARGNGPPLTGVHGNNPLVAGKRSGAEPTCNPAQSGKEVCLMNTAGEVSIEENCLYAHNHAREFHGTPDLKWSKSLEDKSREWAIHLADIGYMEHSKAEDYGENLFWSSFSFDTHATCGDAVYSWYSEVAEPYAYNYNQDQNPGSLHFTQVIWKGTTEVGCGISRTTGGNTDYYVVCQYTSKGNWMGEFIENVPQPNPAVVWQTEQMDSTYDLEKAGQCFDKYDECDSNSCSGMFADFYKPYCGKQCNSGC